MRRSLVIFLGALSLGAGCSITRQIVSPMSFEDAKVKFSLSKDWTVQMQGLITDLVVAEKAQVVLAATIPDIDKERGLKGPAVLKLKGNGKVLWQRPIKSRVKSIALSDDGSLAVVNTYNEKVTAYSHTGSVLWVYDRMCTPIVLELPKRIVCYYDDDNRPKVAFDILDWKGKAGSGHRLSTYRVKSDILAISSSRPDQKGQRYFVLGLVGGRVNLLGPNLKTRWRKKLDGEVVSIAVSAGAPVLVAALLNVRHKTARSPKAGGQKLVLFNDKGEVLDSRKLETHSEQVGLSNSGRLYLYGNSPQGQYIAQYDVKGAKLKLHWAHIVPYQADYSSNLQVRSEVVVVGMEDVVTDALPNPTPFDPRSHLFAFNPEGRTKWDLSLDTEEGGYLFAISGISPDPTSHRLYVATDNGKLSGYRFK